MKNASLFDSVGRFEGCRRLSVEFHHRIEQDPELRGLFPENLDVLADRLALFLAEKLGGPADYTASRGKNSLRCRHAHLRIGSADGDQWFTHMLASMVEVGVQEQAQQWLSNFFRENLPALSDPFLPFYDLPLEALRAHLEMEPALATRSDEGRTLISAAAGEWDLDRVRLLLEYGADPAAKDQMGHGPLYRAANARVAGREPEGVALVELLIQHGARVNEHSGSGGMTALHMAARRGTVCLGEVLLSAGADIEARDRKGETPLRRAVNCCQEPFVRFLLSQGADPGSRDKRGRTPLDAARPDTLRTLLKQGAQQPGAGDYPVRGRFRDL